MIGNLLKEIGAVVLLQIEHSNHQTPESVIFDHLTAHCQQSSVALLETVQTNLISGKGHRSVLPATFIHSLILCLNFLNS